MAKREVPKVERAYSLLTIKAVQEDQRIITGIATTPSVDRMGDIVEPLGVKFTNPMPLLHQHNAEEPVGTVSFDKPTDAGITFTAKLPMIDAPGPLKDRVDTAWQEVKLGLVRAVSIGFRPLEYSFMNDGGIHFMESEVFELSLVTIPAQADATISSIKSIDTALLAAIGKEQPGDPAPGASGTKPTINPVVKAISKQRSPAMNIAEQITTFEATRQAKAARMEAIMEDAAKKGETLNAEQTEEYDGLDAEVKSIDAHLTRLRALEANAAKTAKAVTVAVVTEGAAGAVTQFAQVKATEKVAPGVRFARLVKCLGIAKGSQHGAFEIAKGRYANDEHLISVLKAAVDAGTTGTGNWGEHLVGAETAVYADFVEYLRPMTILGKFGVGGVPSLRRVPFRTALVGQTGGGQGYWVGEGKPKPLTAFDFSRTTLDPLKVANIAVITMELLRDSSPSAEMLVRDSLAAALAERLDLDFIDPAKAASAGVSPASITNGLSAIASSGNTADDIRADIKALFATFIAANNAPTQGVWIMSSTSALGASLLVNALGQPEFPGLNMNGGTLQGLPVITSEYVPSDTAGSNVILAKASDIYQADDGGIAVDMSTEASLEMKDSSLTQDATAGTGTSLVSMFQTNSVAFRAERTINWAKRRASAVALLNAVNWGAGS